jgi:hypothetical protein
MLQLLHFLKFHLGMNPISLFNQHSTSKLNLKIQNLLKQPIKNIYIFIYKH